MNNLQIIKIGGSIVNNEDRLTTFLNQFVKLDYPKILVHGGGAQLLTIVKSWEFLSK